MQNEQWITGSAESDGISGTEQEEQDTKRARHNFIATHAGDAEESPAYSLGEKELEKAVSHGF